LLLFTISACSGGGGGSGGTPLTTIPAGIWAGTITPTGDSPENVILVISSDGTAYLIPESITFGWFGTVSQTQGNVTFSLTNYANDATNGLAVSLTGTNASNTMSLTYSGGIVSVTYNAIYERSSSLAKTNGIWSWTDGASYTQTLTIDASGNIDGSDTDGCVFSGSISTPNTSVNIYNVTLMLELCGAINGTYTGTATLSDGLGAYDSLTIGAANNQDALFFDGYQKQ